MISSRCCVPQYQVLDSTKEFSLLLREETEIVGVSPAVRKEAAARARNADHAGATAGPSVGPVVACHVLSCPGFPQARISWHALR
jgi:hypothetical protein